MKKRNIAVLAASLVAAVAAPVLAADRSWQVSHQTDRFDDHTMLAAAAPADTGPGRMSLYCDTENGFRILFEPKARVMAEGPGVVTFTIDNAHPVTLNANAFGDDDTDAVVVLDTDKVERALAGASHVAVHFAGNGSSGDAVFSFDNLAAQKDLVLKTCPLGR